MINSHGIPSACSNFRDLPLRQTLIVAPSEA
jgi:hypothetical protein